MREIKKIRDQELRDLKDEGIEPLIHLTYDRLANGGRYLYKPRRIDPEAERALRKLFKLEKGENNEDVVDLKKHFC